MSDKVTVLVAGSWGTALATVLAANHSEVYLWTRRSEQAAEINEAHTNEHFLPGISLPANIIATTDMETAVTIPRRWLLLPRPLECARSPAASNLSGKKICSVYMLQRASRRNP